MRSYGKRNKEKMMKWTIKEGLEFRPETIIARADYFKNDPKCQVIGENNVRVSMLVPRDHNSEDKVFFKRYKQRDWKDALKYIFFSSRAKAEWQAINRFVKKKIPVPVPLAFGEERRYFILKDSCLIAEAIPLAVTLNLLQKNIFSEGITRGKVLLKRELIKKLARLIALIHDHGIFYRDLHGGNILLEKDDSGETKIFFVDLHKARFFPFLSSGMRTYDLAKLFHSLSPKRTDCFRFFREYAEKSGKFLPNLKENMKRIEEKSLKLLGRHEKSRTKRCLIASSGFMVFKKRGRRIYLRREDREKLKFIEGHILNKNPPEPNIILETKKSQIFWMNFKKGHEESMLCIKRNNYQGLLSSLRNLPRSSRARKSWIAANGLLARKISTPKSIALIEDQRGWLWKESFFINEYLPQAERLNHYVLKTFSKAPPGQEKRRKEFLSRLAREIRKIHEKGIYHADLKSDNILVEEKSDGGWKFVFVDLDRVAFKKKVSIKKRIINLAQINASVADCITIADRMRFFREYARGTPFFSQRKRFYQRIIEIGSSKNTLPYGVKFLF